MPHVPPAGAADVAVRAGAEPPPVAAGPVQQVVPAARVAGFRPVRDLVPGEARLPEQVVGDQVPVGQRVVVRRGDLAAAHPGGQPGALLDDQRVGGDVIRPGADRRLQRPPPVVVALPRRAVDQVQADVVEPGRARPSHALFWSPGLVLAVKRAQHVRYRALHSERDPGDSLRPQFPEGGGVDGFRVRLDRDFRVTGQAEGLADPGEDAAEPRRGEQRRGAAAEEHRAHRGFARGRTPAARAISRVTRSG